MDAEQPPEIDEHHFREARDFFFSELDGYMKKVARFEDWCRRHPKEEQDESASQG